MGVARGKVGDLVLYRKDGEQISRVRVRKIGNPRTQAQMIQRVFMSTTSRAYSKLQSITDHSFEGQNGVLKNMSRFTKLNIDKFKNQFNNSPTTWRNNPSFNKKNEQGAYANEYIISEGTLQEMVYVYDADSTSLILSGNGKLATDATYQQVVDWLGVQKGDQITIVKARYNKEGSALMGDVEMARIILEPSDGDMSTIFLLQNQVNKPNERNTGKNFVEIANVAGALTFDMGDEAVGISVILSRYENKVWRRSTQTLTVASNAPVDATLGDAVDSWEQAATSSLYLNQAES